MIPLIEPESGFRIAFNMFDTDGNKRVDKNEFLVVSQLIKTTKMIITYIQFLSLHN